MDSVRSFLFLAGLSRYWNFHTKTRQFRAPTPGMSSSDLASLKARANKTLQDYTNELKTRKKNKFLRDQDDYLKNQVYRWRYTTLPDGPPTETDMAHQVLQVRMVVKLDEAAEEDAVGNRPSLFSTRARNPRNLQTQFQTRKKKKKQTRTPRGIHAPILDLRQEKEVSLKPDRHNQH
ncbi:uncharacterized protein [Dendrobates tinctorius]|uniref:uncharacterized protein isoform X2 n=1 Tax=Dendrobates tinctorius TaxID=92724 RepID=UPI003CCA0E8F